MNQCKENCEILANILGKTKNVIKMHFKPNFFVILNDIFQEGDKHNKNNIIWGHYLKKQVAYSFAITV